MPQTPTKPQPHDKEETPLPESAFRYDTTQRYRIECEGQTDYADRIAEAKLIAGELQIERDRLVIITRQHGQPLRWYATLHTVWDVGGPIECTVKLTPLFSDNVPDDVGSRKRANLAALIEREAQRRRRRRRVAGQLRQRKRCAAGRAIVCVDDRPPRPFGSLRQAALWINVNPSTMRRHLSSTRTQSRCGGLRFMAAAELLVLLDGPWATHPRAELLRTAATVAVQIAKAKHTEVTTP